MPQSIIDQLKFAERRLGVDVEELISELEQQFGLALPEDLQTLMGDSLVLAMGGDINVDQVVNSSDGSDIPIGLMLTVMLPRSKTC